MICGGGGSGMWMGGDTIHVCINMHWHPADLQKKHQSDHKHVPSCLVYYVLRTIPITGTLRDRGRPHVTAYIHVYMCFGPCVITDILPCPYLGPDFGFGKWWFQEGGRSSTHVAGRYLLFIAPVPVHTLTIFSSYGPRNGNGAD